MAYLKILNSFRKIIDRILSYRVLESSRKVFVIITLVGLFSAFFLSFGIKMDWINLQRRPHFLHSYFFSFYVAFSVVLVWEVMAMIYTIPSSIADSVGKQFEIMSLIIFRHSY